MRRLVIEGSAIAVLTGSMLIGISFRAGQGSPWITIAAAVAAGVGAVGIAIACRRGATVAVRARRVVALILFGLLVPVLGVVAGWAAELGTWGMWVTVALVFVAAVVGLSRITPLNIDSWAAAEQAMPSNTPLERTREE